MNAKKIVIYNCNECPEISRCKFGDKGNQTWWCNKMSKLVANVEITLKFHMNGYIETTIENKPEIPKWCPLPDA